MNPRTAGRLAIALAAVSLAFSLVTTHRMRLLRAENRALKSLVANPACIEGKP